MSRPFLADVHGATEVMGNMMLIGITVLVMGGLAVLVLSQPGPSDDTHADLAVTVEPGQGGWGTGDELLRMSHRGGEALSVDNTAILIDHLGTHQRIEGGALGGAFADGSLTVGETWSTTLTVGQADSLQVTVLETAKRTGGSGIIARASVGPGSAGTVDCSEDTVAPVVTIWSQTPADVDALSVGAVDVTATIGDGCAGVDTAVAPHLFYRLTNDGTGAFIDAGAMTLGAGTAFAGQIPSHAWTLEVGQTLQYFVANMQDHNGNVGNSTLRGDVIQLLGTDQFTDGYAENAGTVTSFAAAQSQGDGLDATLEEGTTGGTSMHYATASSGSGGSGDPSNTEGPPQNQYYVLGSNGDEVVDHTFDITGGTGTITTVELVFEGHYENLRINDAIDLDVDATGSYQSVANDFVPAAGTDAQSDFDITSLRGSWDWSDIAALQVRATYDKQGATDAMDVYVDTLAIRVTVGAQGHDLDIELTFPDPPLLTTLHLLEMDVDVSGETFAVEVWDGVSWNQRGPTLDGAMTYYYLLAGTEAMADLGHPRIRLIDLDSQAGPGTIELDYAKVVSA